LSLWRTWLTAPVKYQQFERQTAPNAKVVLFDAKKEIFPFFWRQFIFLRHGSILRGPGTTSTNFAVAGPRSSRGPDIFEQF
jgi:hypothetical protein